MIPYGYKEYLTTRHWRTVRSAALKRSLYRCEECNSTKDELKIFHQKLEVHHKHYRTLGNEQPEDLIVLCPPCHWLAEVSRRIKRIYEEAAVLGFSPEGQTNSAYQMIVTEHLLRIFEINRVFREAEMPDTGNSEEDLAQRFARINTYHRNIRGWIAVDKLILKWKEKMLNWTPEIGKKSLRLNASLFYRSDEMSEEEAHAYIDAEIEKW